MANNSLSIPRESEEFLPLGVTDKGSPVTGYETALVLYGLRPTTWVGAYADAGEHGVFVSGPTLGPGTFGIWVRVTANPESIVVGPTDKDQNGRPIGAGYITIT